MNCLQPADYGGDVRKPRETKLERLFIADACRVVKDWFATREQADAALVAIKAHIDATGETHTVFCHTHTRPPKESEPVYIGEFSLPKKFKKAKRWSPCPVCLDEFPKFGQGKIAWFPAERVIRLIGDDCFRKLNPEAHEKAQKAFDIEQETKHNTDFLLANHANISEVIATLRRAVGVAKAVETFHEQLHRKLKISNLNLWPYVAREGQLSVLVKEKEFRRERDGEMYEHEVDVSRVMFRLPGYQMLDPVLGSPSTSLENALRQIQAHDHGREWPELIAKMDFKEKAGVAKVLSRCVANAIEKIAELEAVRRFVERVSINTLRNWGLHEGCPIARYYSHEGSRFLFGRSDYECLSVEFPSGITGRIGQIDFWVPREKRR